MSPDGKLAIAALSCSGGKPWRRLKVLDLEAGTDVDTVDLESSSDHAVSLAFLPDGRSFVAGTARGVVLQFEIP